MTADTDDTGGHSTRRLAFVALVTVALALSAGCTGALSGGDAAGASKEPALDTVPAGADVIAYADVQGMMTDDALRNVSNTSIALQSKRPGYEGPANVEAAIAEFENESELDMSKLAGITFFGQYANQTGGSDEYSAAIISADWTEENVVDAMESDDEGGLDYNLTETEYEGYTLYEPSSEDGSWLGIVSDTVHVTGNESAVKDALAVAAGDQDAVSGDLKTEFENTKEGAYVRFASSVPQERVPAEQVGSGTQYNTEVFNDVTVVSGSQYTDGKTVGLSFNMRFSSSSSASSAKDVVKGVVTTYRGLITDQQVTALLSEENLTVTRTGDADRTVRIRSENSVTTINELLEKFYTYYAQPAGGSTAA